MKQILFMLSIFILGACDFVPSRIENLASLLPQELHEEIRSGDILFRQGRSFASLTVLNSDRESDYSHLGIAIEVDGEIVVSHAVPGESEDEFVFSQSIEEFFAQKSAKKGAVMRLPLDSVDLATIVSKAIEIQNLNIPFDHEYNATNGDKLYCTEYVWILFNTIGVDLTRGQRANVSIFNISEPLIFPSHIYKYPKLEVVGEF